MSREPDRYGNDVDWDLIKALKKLGWGLIRDNSVERGPLKSISSNRYKSDKVLKFNQTTAMQVNMKDALGSKHLPVDSREFPTDTIRHWNSQIHKPVAVKRLKENGWMTEDGSMVEIDYFINKQGFRHDGNHIDYMSEQGGVIYLGDSHTMGVGMHLEETWTYLAHYCCPKTQNLRYLNMGSPGYGVDCYYRLLKRFIGELKPDVVVMSYPWQNTRTEMFNVRKNIWEVQTVTKAGRDIVENTKKSAAPVEWFHTAQSYIRWYKNLDAMKWLCYSNGAKFYAVEEDVEGIDDDLQAMNNEFVHHVDANDLGRDLVHYGRKTHKHNGEVLTKVLNHLL